MAKLNAMSGAELAKKLAGQINFLANPIQMLGPSSTYPVCFGSNNIVILLCIVIDCLPLNKTKTKFLPSEDHILFGGDRW